MLVALDRYSSLCWAQSMHLTGCSRGMPCPVFEQGALIQLSAAVLAVGTSCMLCAAVLPGGVLAAAAPQ